MTEINRMDIDEFQRLGFLQEANRHFFHPLGLALEIVTDEETGVTTLGGVWDYRHDPEGMAFFRMSVEEAERKAQIVAEQLERTWPGRKAKFGWMVQPLDTMGDDPPGEL